MPGVFDVEKQLVFYGAYHNNKVNVRIHMICVPLLIWTFQIMLASLPTPEWFPKYRYDFNSILSFEFNWATVQAITYIVYYFTLLPTGAIIYFPQSLISVLSAIALARDPVNVKKAFALHIVCWLAQFYGHGAHERRAPALLDNLLGAVVLAPFFVHLELLFRLGYYKDLHHNIQNGVGKEILKFRQETARAKRES